jgi:hypothetical protein
MATRDEWLKQCWDQTINMAMQEYWIENNIRAFENNPDEPFADVGEALKRLLAQGASRRDLSILVRQAAYEAVFDTLYMLDDPGVDEEGGLACIHESLLSADPSGLEGRPGSAPEKEN